MRRRLVLPPGTLLGEPQTVELGADQIRHLRVLRLASGTELELTDGEGHEADGILEVVDKRTSRVRLDTVRSVPKPRPEIVLLQGVGKGDKLDLVTRQAGELGAARLVPILTERAVARGDNKLDRLRGIADDALRVSRRAHRMVVSPPLPLEAVLRSESRGRKIAFVVGGERSLPEALLEADPAEPVVLLVGPEGGFSAAERAQVTDAGFIETHLGPYVLRTETAGPAVVAMVRFAFA